MTAPDLDPPRRKLRHVRVADTVAADLRSKILANGFPDSVLPTQHEIAAEWGAGLPSVREALRILEAEGLITIRRGNQGGAMVHSPDVDSASYALGLALQSTYTTVNELGVALRHFEPICAGLCAASPSRPEIVAHLEELNVRAVGVIDDPMSFTQACRQFHADVVRLCGNKPMALVVQSMVGLWTQHEEGWVQELASGPSYPARQELRKVTDAHETITRAIALGDSELATRTSRGHLDGAQYYFLGDDDERRIDVTSR